MGEVALYPGQPSALVEPWDPFLQAAKEKLGGSS